MKYRSGNKPGYVCVRKTGLFVQSKVIGLCLSLNTGETKVECGSACLAPACPMLRPQEEAERGRPGTGGRGWTRRPIGRTGAVVGHLPELRPRRRAVPVPPSSRRYGVTGRGVALLPKLFCPGLPDRVRRGRKPPRASSPCFSVSPAAHDKERQKRGEE